MTLYGASEFLSHLDLLRTVAITGGKGSGKDLISFELSDYFLNRGYKFASNQNNVWQDDLYIKEYWDSERLKKFRSSFIRIGNKPARMVRVDMRIEQICFGLETEERFEPVEIKGDELLDLKESYGYDDQGFYYLRPNVRNMVLVLTEGGRYLRRWKYFEDMYEFTRKTNNYILIPSIKLPHVDLCEMILINVFPFVQYTGMNGGVWYWYIGGQGLMKPKSGAFVHVPNPNKYGIYDTNDLSKSPTEAIKAFSRQIRLIQEEEYNRDFLSTLGDIVEGGDDSGLANFARTIERASLSLPRGKT